MVVNDTTTLRRFLALLDSQHSIPILTKGVERPVSAPALVEELRAPRSTIYRCIKDLMDEGLLVKVRSQRNLAGHWFDEYRTAVNEVRFYINESGIAMELVPAKDMASRLLKLWAYVERK